MDINITDIFSQAIVFINAISIFVFIAVMVGIIILVFKLRNQWVNRPVTSPDIFEGLYEAVDNDYDYDQKFIESSDYQSKQ